MILSTLCHCEAGALPAVAVSSPAWRPVPKHEGLPPSPDPLARNDNKKLRALRVSAVKLCIIPHQRHATLNP